MIVASHSDKIKEHRTTSLCLSRAHFEIRHSKTNTVRQLVKYIPKRESICDVESETSYCGRG